MVWLGRMRSSNVRFIVGNILREREFQRNCISRKWRLKLTKRNCFSLQLYIADFDLQMTLTYTKCNRRE